MIASDFLPSACCMLAWGVGAGVRACSREINQPPSEVGIVSRLGSQPLSHPSSSPGKRRHLCGASVARPFFSACRSRPVIPKATNDSDDNSESSDLIPAGRPDSNILGMISRMKSATHIFVVAMVYIFYFFGASAWDGKGKKH